MCIFWRNPNNSNIEYRLIDLDNGKKLSPILLEMLTDDLPQLLQNLLVGVERAIGRIPINNLSFPIQTKTSGRGAASTATAITASADNGNVLNAINANDILVSGEDCLRDVEEDVNSNSKNVISSGLETNTKITLSYSPKCALKRSEQITENNFLNNKYILRKYSTKFDNTPTPSMEDSTAKHPLFCLGNTFPHIDSDEENSSDDQRHISIDSG